MKTSVYEDHHLKASLQDSGIMTIVNADTSNIHVTLAVIKQKTLF